jgi:DNA-binding PucR family transcriptional regulator
MAATPAREAAVTRFDARPLAVTAISASEILPRISRTVFGPLLDLPPDDQAILLETLEAWRDNDGSAATAAAALYCHPNTVRHRLRRIEQLTGRSLNSPRAAAELCLALEGVRLLPDPPPS